MPDDDDHLEVVFEDCKKYLARAANTADWLLVDIYDAEAWGPVYDDVPFYRLCKKALTDGGISSYNVLGGEDFTKSLDNISKAFDGQVLVTPDVAEATELFLPRRDRRKLIPSSCLIRELLSFRLQDTFQLRKFGKS